MIIGYVGGGDPRNEEDEETPRGLLRDIGGFCAVGLGVLTAMIVFGCIHYHFSYPSELTIQRDGEDIVAKRRTGFLCGERFVLHSDRSSSLLYDCLGRSLEGFDFDGDGFVNKIAKQTAHGAGPGMINRLETLSSRGDNGYKGSFTKWDQLVAEYQKRIAEPGI